VIVDAVELVGQPAYRRRACGLALVPQGRRLFRSLTVAEHLLLARPGRDGREARDRVLSTFPRLRDRLKTPAGSLSGGEQSMLAIARALLLDPRLLVMDEPTEGLAPLLVAAVREVVTSLRSGDGPTVLLVEQNLGFVVGVADHVAVMERGAIVRVLEPDELSDSRALGALVLGRHGP
jgi:ABC-type branched-subunit amino acid transport system ATPase component